MDIPKKLFEIGAIKFGTFTLKSGIISPIYIDLRLSVSYPKLLVAIAEKLHSAVRDAPYEIICGVPYTALPLATAISIQHNIPMIIKRKEKKDYGLRKMIEGAYSPGQNCLLIEDIITSGQSILETIDSIKEEKLQVTDIAVLIDREQGGKKLLESKGYRLHPVFSLLKIIETLRTEKAISEERARSVFDFIQTHQTYA